MSELKNIFPGEPIPPDSIFHERRYRVAQKVFGGIITGHRLLDIGCGNGSQTGFFANNFQQTVGIDLQVHRLHGFSSDLADRGIANITLLGGDGEALPFQDKFFDCITCFEVLEHVKDQLNMLSEIIRVLKPDGLVIISVPHRWWIFETHGANLPLLPWNRVPFFSWLPKGMHDKWARARIYRRREINKIISEAGFQQIRTRLLTAPMDVVKNKTLRNFLRSTIFRRDTTRIPFLASTIFILAKKST